MVTDDDLPKFFVARVELMEKIIVEEVAKRAVADVVNQSGHAEKGFNVIGTGSIWRSFLKKGIEVPGKQAGDMHSPKGMDESGMFSRRIDPSGTLQLVNISKSLDPG